MEITYRCTLNDAYTLWGGSPVGLPYGVNSFHVEQYNVIPTHYIEDTLTGWTHGKGFYHSMASHFDSDALYIEHPTQGNTFTQ